MIRHAVRYGTPDEQGETRRQRNARFGIDTPEPNPIAVDLDYLIDWFWDIGAGRSHGFNGPNPLSMTEIAHWAALTGTVLMREEVGIIRAMDAAYLSSVAQEQAEATERAKHKKD